MFLNSVTKTDISVNVNNLEVIYLKSFQVKANNIDGRIYSTSCDTILWPPCWCPKEGHQDGGCILNTVISFLKIIFEIMLQTNVSFCPLYNLLNY